MRKIEWKNAHLKGELASLGNNIEKYLVANFAPISSSVKAEIFASVLATSYLPNVIYSLSPSFPHQIISDPAGDWDFPALPASYDVTQAYNLTKCI